MKNNNEENKKLLKEMYEKTPEDKQSEAKLIYNELVFILDTLEALKKDINNKGAVEHFINGKQDFLRESPALTSYNKLMKTYNTFFKTLANLQEELPKEEETDGFDEDDLI